MDYKSRYETWMASNCVGKCDKEELAQLRDQENELRDRFACDLTFGTGGLRGLLGLGSNRMNVYTVRKASQGLANYILRTAAPGAAVAIGYDSRHNSALFAKETAAVMAANGLTAWIYPRLEPTPALSFAVRNLHCVAGVCITASHNPAQYNGYKVYGSDGCQITLEIADNIFREIEALDIFRDIKHGDFERGEKDGMIRQIPEDTLNRFVEAVYGQRIDQNISCTRLKVVYTPLNGTGLECVCRIFKKLNITDVTVVPEQELPDANFTTCPNPNPEEPASLELGLRLCRQKQADLLLGTDPDCDRLGVAVFNGTEYRLLTGNEVGILLLDYICRIRQSRGRMPQNPVAITTIVSTGMADAIAAKYGVRLIRVLTGFKFIGEQIGYLDQKSQADRFIFGFEESYGYLSGSYVRDKDAVNAVMLVCEMAHYYKVQKSSIWQALQALYHEFGYYHSRLVSLTFPGMEGAGRMKQLMLSMRRKPLQTIGGYMVEAVVDYQMDNTGLPISDVLEYKLAGDAKVIIRPSGTEPKVKAYIHTKADNMMSAIADADKLVCALQELLC